jgi:hypothetical protein
MAVIVLAIPFVIDGVTRTLSNKPLQSDRVAARTVE